MTTGQTFPQVFKLTGEVDLARQAELDEIEAAAAQVEFATVDLTEVTFLDSTALKWLLSIKRALDGKNGRLRLLACSGTVTRVLSLAGLEDVFETIVVGQGPAES